MIKSFKPFFNISVLFIQTFSSCIKMSKDLSARFYLKKTKKDFKKACKRYQNLSEEETNKTQEYGRERMSPKRGKIKAS